MWKEFREFASRGSVIDLAIGVLIGGAFAPIAKSLVDDILMPPIGLLLGRVDFTNFYALLKQGSPRGPYASLEAAKAAGAVTMNYGLFINTIITFLIVAFVAFLIVRVINDLRRKEQGAAPEEPATKDCPRCLSKIPAMATRCAFCTSELGPVAN